MSIQTFEGNTSESDWCHCLTYNRVENTVTDKALPLYKSPFDCFVVTVADFLSYPDANQKLCLQSKSCDDLSAKDKWFLFMMYVWQFWWQLVCKCLQTSWSFLYKLLTAVATCQLTKGNTMRLRCSTTYVFVPSLNLNNLASKITSGPFPAPLLLIYFATWSLKASKWQQCQSLKNNLEECWRESEI